MTQNKAFINLIANKFIDLLDEKGIICEDEDEAACIFEQIIGEQIEQSNRRIKGN